MTKQINVKQAFEISIYYLHAIAALSYLSVGGRVCLPDCVKTDNR